jgi:hypothetical protein
MHHPENIARARRIIEALDACPDGHYYKLLVTEARESWTNPESRDAAAQGFADLAVALLTDLRHLCHIRLPEGAFEDALALSERHAIAEIDSPE